MDRLSVQILNWEKYNEGRKDVKNPTWWRCQISMPTNQDLFHLTPEEKWVWVCLLSHAADKQTGSLQIDVKWFAWYCQASEQAVWSALDKLKGKTIQIDEQTRDVHVTSTARARDEHVTLQTDRQTDKQTNRSDKPSGPDRTARLNKSDFERVYTEHYPRKEGKRRGIEICAKEIRTPEEFARFEKAVKNYASRYRRPKAPGEFRPEPKHFATFVRCWTDYETMDFEQRPEVAAPSGPTGLVSAAESQRTRAALAESENTPPVDPEKVRRLIAQVTGRMG